MKIISSVFYFRINWFYRYYTKKSFIVVLFTSTTAPVICFFFPGICRSLTVFPTKCYKNSKSFRSKGQWISALHGSVFHATFSMFFGAERNFYYRKDDKIELRNQKLFKVFWSNDRNFSAKMLLTRAEAYRYWGSANITCVVDSKVNFNWITFN